MDIKACQQALYTDHIYTDHIQASSGVSLLTLWETFYSFLRACSGGLADLDVQYCKFACLNGFYNVNGFRFVTLQKISIGADHLIFEGRQVCLPEYQNCVRLPLRGTCQ